MIHEILSEVIEYEIRYTKIIETQIDEKILGFEYIGEKATSNDYNEILNKYGELKQDKDVTQIMIVKRKTTETKMHYESIYDKKD